MFSLFVPLFTVFCVSKITRNIMDKFLEGVNLGTSNKQLYFVGSQITEFIFRFFTVLKVPNVYPVELVTVGNFTVIKHLLQWEYR